MTGYTTKNKTFNSGALRDSNVVVLGDGYSGSANFARVDSDGYQYVYLGNGAATSVVSADDKNYGVVGPNTLRSAAQIGNASGPADFNAGITDAYTLRVTSNLSDGYGSKLSSQETSNGLRNGLDAWSIKGVPQHFNGTVSVSPIDITPAFTTASLLLRNMDTANKKLQVSFDSGASYFDIDKDGVLAIEAEVNSFKIKGSAAHVDYQILVTHK
jgi:hypothetical protein